MNKQASNIVDVSSTQGISCSYVTKTWHNMSDTSAKLDIYLSSHLFTMLSAKTYLKPEKV